MKTLSGGRRGYSAAYLQRKIKEAEERAALRTCEDFFPHEDGFLPEICCSRCHEEARAGTFPLGGVPGRANTSVCCTVRLALVTKLTKGGTSL